MALLSALILYESVSLDVLPLLSGFTRSSRYTYVPEKLIERGIGFLRHPVHLQCFEYFVIKMVWAQAYLALLLKPESLAVMWLVRWTLTDPCEDTISFFAVTPRALMFLSII